MNQNQDLNTEKPFVENLEEKPKASEQMQSATTPDIPEFGWSSYAERMNGRFAMIGLVSVLLVEILSKKSFLHWAGFIN